MASVYFSVTQAGRPQRRPGAARQPVQHALCAFTPDDAKGTWRSGQYPHTAYDLAAHAAPGPGSSHHRVVGDERADAGRVDDDAERRNPSLMRAVGRGAPSSSSSRRRHWTRRAAPTASHAHGDSPERSQQECRQRADAWRRHLERTQCPAGRGDIDTAPRRARNAQRPSGSAASRSSSSASADARSAGRVIDGRSPAATFGTSPARQRTTPSERSAQASRYAGRREIYLAMPTLGPLVVGGGWYGCPADADRAHGGLSP